jgi:hypothetical protein
MGALALAALGGLRAAHELLHPLAARCCARRSSARYGKDDRPSAAWARAECGSRSSASRLELRLLELQATLELLKGQCRRLRPSTPTEHIGTVTPAGETPDTAKAPIGIGRSGRVADVGRLGLARLVLLGHILSPASLGLGIWGSSSSVIPLRHPTLRRARRSGPGANRTPGSHAGTCGLRLSSASVVACQCAARSRSRRRRDLPFDWVPLA